MTGRFEPLRVPHWSFSEMAQAFGFDLDHYLFYGGYPRVSSHIADEHQWRTYITEEIVKTTIDRDVLSLAQVNKPRLMKLLLDLCVDYSGKILSYNKMLGLLHDAESTTALAHYFQLLSEIGLVIGLDRYSRNPRIARASSPKLNVLNTALLTAGGRCSFEQAVADRTFWEQIVEAAVGAHLVNSGSTATRVYYWRDGVLEVDFVVTRGPKVIAIEVKSGRRFPPKRGVEEFRERFDPHRSLLVGEGGIPLEEFPICARRPLVRDDMKSIVQHTVSEVDPIGPALGRQHDSIDEYRCTPVWVLVYPGTAISFLARWMAVQSHNSQRPAWRHPQSLGMRT